MNDFNLRALVREVARSSVDPAYDALAAEVIKRIKGDEVWEVLEIAMPVFIRQVVSEMRRPGPVATAPHAGTNPRSWKQIGIRDGWQKALLDIYATETGNKHLRDFTHDDLMFQAEVLRTKAEQNVAKAKGWERLAKALEEYEAATVKDLPAEVQMRVLGARAA